MDQNNEEALLIETGRMARRLFHDFKNQIQGVKLYADYLKQRFSGNSEAIEIAEKIILGLNAMADQAKLISKLTGPIKLRREECNLAQLVEIVMASVKSQAEAKQLRMIAAQVDKTPTVSIDLQQMHTALSSIIARAIDSSPRNGEVKISLQSVDNSLQIEILDQGEMPNEQKVKSFFEPLTNERINQTALGLALARRIIELHGGEVSAQAGSPVGVLVKVILHV
jgi:signal transduction histidine kinase